MRMNCNLIYVLRNHYFMDMVRYCNKFGWGYFWVDNFGWIDSFWMDMLFGSSLGVWLAFTIAPIRTVVLITFAITFYSIFALIIRNMKRKY